MRFVAVLRSTLIEVIHQTVPGRVGWFLESNAAVLPAGPDNNTSTWD